jgi:hypothetical protein
MKKPINWMTAPSVPMDIILKKAKGATDAQLGGTIVNGPNGQQTFLRFERPLAQEHQMQGSIYADVGNNFDQAN